MPNSFRAISSSRHLYAIAALVCALSVLLSAAGRSETAALTLPGRLGAYISRYVKLTPTQQSQLAAGQAVTKLLDSDPSTEVAVFGAIWVNAPIATYVAA